MAPETASERWRRAADEASRGATPSSSSSAAAPNAGEPDSGDGRGQKRSATDAGFPKAVIPPRFKDRIYTRTADGTAHDPRKFEQDFREKGPQAWAAEQAAAAPAAAPAISEDLVCWNFKQGYCVRGRMCNYVHPGVSKGNAKAIGVKRPFNEGSRIQIIGLKSKPEYNERVGECEEFDMETSRWQVRLGNGVRLKIKEENL
eukprot:CAMPEP_0206600464 /NCGR_PEP_ID=MMETSP0325_2-20121206/45823_1 /ASSEMBLY_ACC=CAM_ASM_000347 /TAXON_ID=2866 /ORGANISM="Crypthecodinium cohnii, Strain Seligo" /LENGTH=201 /DNA_ID=CAMNT_0054111797 /DNA_START=27 /DNA_END=628 /DNA_ORIENTATION=-